MSTPDRIQHNPALTPPLQPGQAQKGSTTERTADGKSFNDILRSKVAERVPTGVAAPAAAPAEPAVTWSAHAAARLHQRGINLSEGQLARLDSAVEKATAKGSRDALVMLDGTALVVSVKNRTVITAVGQNQARENVFTNIDSAVIA